MIGRSDGHAQRACDLWAYLLPDRYRGNGVVMLQHVTRIVVTADKSARQHAPTKPEVIVLDSSSKAAM